MTDQPEELDLRFQDIAEHKRQELLRLFPEVGTEGGKVDFERLKLARQKTVTFEFDGMRFEEGLRLDLLVGERVVVESKSVENLALVHPKHVLIYLGVPNLPVGLLMNFGAATLKEGLRRIVNNYTPSALTRTNLEAAIQPEQVAATRHRGVRHRPLL